MKSNTDLKTVAKSIGLFKHEDIEDKYKDDAFDTRIGYGKRDNIIPEFITTLKGYEYGVFYECKQDTDYKGVVSFYIDHSYLLVKKIDSNIPLMLRKDRNNKYYFYPHYDLMRKYNKISHYIKEDALKELKEPNYIGVFTEKKINDWSAYCENYIKILDTTFDKLESENNKLQTEIDNFIASVPGCKVSKSDSGSSFRTTVTTKYFEVFFEHFKDQKYLSKKITYNGSLKDIVSIETKK